MTTAAKKHRRAYGIPTIETRANKQGREVYYGRFRAGGRQQRARSDDQRAHSVDLVYVSTP